MNIYCYRIYILRQMSSDNYNWRETTQHRKMRIGDSCFPGQRGEKCSDREGKTQSCHGRWMTNAKKQTEILRINEMTLTFTWPLRTGSLDFSCMGAQTISRLLAASEERRETSRQLTTPQRIQRKKLQPEQWQIISTALRNIDISHSSSNNESNQSGSITPNRSDKTST